MNSTCRGLEALLKQARQDGGPCLIGYIISRRGDDSYGHERTAVLLVDNGQFARNALKAHRDELANILHCDAVRIQSTITDPVIQKAIDLGGMATMFADGVYEEYSTLPGQPRFQTISLTT